MTAAQAGISDSARGVAVANGPAADASIDAVQDPDPADGHGLSFGQQGPDAADDLGALHSASGIGHRNGQHACKPCLYIRAMVTTAETKCAICKKCQQPSHQTALQAWAPYSYAKYECSAHVVG